MMADHRPPVSAVPAREPETSAVEDSGPVPSAETYAVTATTDLAPAPNGALRLGLVVIRLGPVLILALIIAAISFLSPVFLTTGNAGNVLSQTAAIAVLAIGQLLVILTRGIDLSVGSTLALASVVGALAFARRLGRVLVILVMLAYGRGRRRSVNGGVYVWGRLPHPFIITLATLSIARGLALRLSGGQPKRGMPEIVQTIGGGSIGWLPYSAFLVARTRAAVGAGPDRAPGVGSLDLRGRRQPGGRPPHRHPGASGARSPSTCCAGCSAGVAAIITSGRLNAGSPTSGDLAELDSIAAVDHRRRQLPRRPRQRRQRARRRADDRRDPQRHEPAERRRVPAADRHRRRHRARRRARRRAAAARGAVPGAARRPARDRVA